MTENPQQNGLILDWLAFTWDYDRGLPNVRRLFGNWEAMGRGIRGYSHAGKLPCGGVVGWHPEHQIQGVHVEMSSGNLGRLAELRPEFADAQALLLQVVDLGGRISRIDFALDDRIGLLTVDRLSSAIDQEQLTKRSKKGTDVRALFGGEGRTFNVGHRSSDGFIRIYDKRAEQLEQHNVDDDPGHWIRVELELKHKKAHAVTIGFLDKGPEYVIGVIRGLLEFREQGTDANKTKWPVSPWWDEFMQGVDAVRLSMPKEPTSLLRTKAWLERQVAPALAFVTLADGGSVDYLYDLIDKGSRRLSLAHKEVLDQIEFDQKAANHATD